MTPGKLVYDRGVEPVPGYRLTDYLGGGSFGEVWKTVDLSTSKHFALKIIDLSYSSSALKELRALKLVMNLNHPNLVPITKAWLKDKHGQSLDLHSVDLVVQKGKLKLLLILMGLGEKSLSARLKEVNRAAGGVDPDDDEPLTRGIPPEELANYMRGAAKGIDYLNAVRHEGVDPASDGPIVHCDIKPDNMMIVAGTEVQIADCGVAVSLNQDTRKTVSAAFSPVYAPPELSNNRPSSGTDQYSLAISYYELRTGRRPFAAGTNQFEMMTAHALGNLDFSSPTLTSGERQVLKWATSPRIAERYPSCFDMVKQLERGIEGLTPRGPSELHKSVPVILVPPAPAPGSAPRVELPGAGRLDRTSAHHVDLFTPPPVVSTPGSEPYLSGLPAGTGSRPDAAPPAANAPLPHWSRPSILENPDDPNGRELPAPELDDELRQIIAGSQVVATPSRRRLPGESDARPNLAPPAVPLTSGLSATKFKVETDVPPIVDLVATSNPAETDPDAREGRRPAARRRNDGTVVPGQPEYDPPALTLKQKRSPKPQESTAWDKDKVAGQKSSAPILGVAVGVLILLAGVVGAYLVLASSPVVPDSPDTKPSDGGGSPPTKPSDGGGSPPTKPSDGGGSPPTKPIGPTPQPGETEQQSFERQLAAALKPPFSKNQDLAALFGATEKGSPRRDQLLKALLGDSKDTARLADLADFATAFDKWPDFEDRRVDLANAWYEARLRPRYDEAVAALLAAPTPDAVPGKLAGFRKAMSLPTVAKLDAFFPDTLQGVHKFDALTNTWEDAKNGLRGFAEAVTVADEPPAGKFFAAEYMRLARKASVPIAELKAFRHTTKTWSGIDESYQAALADHVVKELTDEKPNWRAIAETCGSDAANGWKALAAADEVVTKSGDGNAPLPRLPGKFDARGQPFAKYLECCTKADIGGLVELYKKDADPSPLLNTTARKKLAADLILKNTPPLKAHREWKDKPVELFFTNPYEGLGERQLASTAARLDTAARLVGELPVTERFHQYLVGSALTAPEKAALAALPLKEDDLLDEDIAATLACYKRLADDKALDHKGQAAAAARAARLAFKRIDLAFFDCGTDDKVLEREIKLAKAIGEAVSNSLEKAEKAAQPAQPADLTSLKFSDLKAKIVAKVVTSSDRLTRLEQLKPQLKDLPEHPDRAAWLAMCAYYRLLDVYMKDPTNKVVWDQVKGEANESLRLHPLGYAASVVVCIINCGEYKYNNVNIYKVPAPAGREITTNAEINQAIQRFRSTRAVLRTRKSSALDNMQVNFLDLRIIQLRDTDKEDKTADTLELESIKIRGLAELHAPPAK